MGHQRAIDYVIDAVEHTVPPGIEIDDPGCGYTSFIDRLSSAITKLGSEVEVIRERGKLLLEALRKKWPDEVEAHMVEAERLAKEYDDDLAEED